MGRCENVTEEMFKKWRRVNKLNKERGTTTKRGKTTYFVVGVDHSHGGDLKHDKSIKKKNKQQQQQQQNM